MSILPVPGNSPAPSAGDGQSGMSLNIAGEADNSATTFLQLLVKNLPTQAKKHITEKSTVTPAQLAPNETADSTHVSVHLNLLPDQTEIPDIRQKNSNLSSGTLISTRAASKKEDKIPAASTSLSERDMQALLAMLPHHSVPPPETPGQNMRHNDLSNTWKNNKGGSSASLNTLLPADGNKPVDGKDRPENAAASPLSSALTDAGANKNGTQTEDVAFLPVLSHVSKESNKKDSAASQCATLTHNVLCAASTTQQAPAATLMTATTAPPLNAQAGSQEWQQALGQQVLIFSHQGQHSAELHLHAENLGSIQVSLQLNNDQANLNMVSDHSQVRAALEAALPQLRHTLAESGISLGQSNISSDAFAQGQASAGQQESRNNHRGNTFNPASDKTSDTVVVATPASLQGRIDGSGAVDIFA